MTLEKKYRVIAVDTLNKSAALRAGIRIIYSSK